jgi:predicted AAA+ superfamily ATPase
MKKNKENLIKVIDFWNKSISEDKLYTRSLIDDIDYKNKEIVDLLGPRRSGKSSVLKLIINRLGLSDNFLYINFEDPYFIENNKAEIIEELIEVFLENYSGNLKYLFFDEIQEIEGWERAVRKLRDGKNYKIFITGSSSTLLSRELASSLTGRHISYKVLPLSFLEYLFFEGINVDSKKDLILKDALLYKKFKEYLNGGGFPEVVITKNASLLKSYFYDILQKDVIARNDIRDKEALEKMAVFLFSNAGKIVSIKSLKDAFALSFFSASTYLEYLKDAFLVFELSQFSYSLKKQGKALKKIYIVDTGIANVVSFKFSEDRGRALENLVYLELLRRGKEIFYYKTKNNKEVDFLIKEKAKAKELLQVSWSIEDKKTKERELNSLFEAMEETGLKNGLILTENEEGEEKKDRKIIHIKPVYKWLLEDKIDEG